MTKHNRRMKLLVLLLCFLLFGSLISAAKPTADTKPAEDEEVIVTEGFKEAPMLAAKVTSGELPPVEDRLPLEPAVRMSISEVGKYSGQMFTLAMGQGAWGNDIMVGGEGANLFRHSEDALGVEGNLAKAFEVNPDNTEVTIYLREGAKWSDGAPFTTEDMRFMYEDMHWNPDVRTWGTGGITGIEVLDDMTIKLKNEDGLGKYPRLNLARWFSGRIVAYHPSHFLKKFHIEYNADADKVAKDNGFDDWGGYMFNEWSWMTGEHVGLPQMTPWIIVETNPNAMRLERNPYYWAVDQTGQQLPYFDEVLISIVAAENYNLKAIAGEADIAYVQTSLPNIQLYRENEKAGGYTTILWPGTKVADFAMSFNPYNPDEYKAQLSLDIRFRQALNLAVDRDEINNTLYFGLAVPRQISPIPSTSYYKKEWEDYFAQYDPERAEKLLDEVGLDKRDRDGYRVRADNGETLSWVIEYTNDAYTPGFELVREYYEAIGLKTTIKIQDAGVLEKRMFNSLTDMIHYQYPPDGREVLADLWQSAFVRPMWNYTYDTFLHLRHEYGDKPLPENWIDVKPKPETAKELGWEIGGVPATDWYKELWYANEDFGAAEPGSKEYMELANKIYSVRVEMLHDVGIIGLAPKPVIVKNSIGNFPQPGYMPGMSMDIPLASYFVDQLYRK